MTDLIKRYALSTFVTFFSAFSLFLITNIATLIQNPGGSVTTAVIIALVLAAVRAGVKAVSEAVVGGHADLPSLTASTPAATTTIPPAQQ
jgi:hypothetical protein